MYIRKNAWLAEMRRWRDEFKKRGAEVDLPVYTKFQELQIQFSFRLSKRKVILVEALFVPADGRDDMLEVKFVQLKPGIPKGLEAGKLASSIELIERKARDYCVRVESADCLEEIDEAVERFLMQGSAEDLELRGFYTQAVKRRGYDAHIAPVVLAISYCADARKALEQSDLERAWSCLDRGEFFVSDDLLIDDPHKRFQDRARSGGNARAARRFDPVKRRVMELLRLCAPAEGWKSKVEASEKLAQPVWDALSLGPLADGGERVLTYDNLQQTLYRWLMKDAQIREQFEANKKLSA